MAWHFQPSDAPLIAGTPRPSAVVPGIEKRLWGGDERHIPRAVGRNCGVAFRVCGGSEYGIQTASSVVGPGSCSSRCGNHATHWPYIKCMRGRVPQRGDTREVRLAHCIAGLWQFPRQIRTVVRVPLGRGGSGVAGAGVVTSGDRFRPAAASSSAFSFPGTSTWDGTQIHCTCAWHKSSRVTNCTQRSALGTGTLWLHQLAIFHLYTGPWMQAVHRSRESTNFFASILPSLKVAVSSPEALDMRTYT
jgi:hypothetical protein